MISKILQEIMLPVFFIVCIAISFDFLIGLMIGYNKDTNDENNEDDNNEEK